MTWDQPRTTRTKGDDSASYKIMNFDLVLIERDSITNSAMNFSTSAILVNDECVISTSHIFLPEITSTDGLLKELHTRTFHVDPFDRKVNVNVVMQDKTNKLLYQVKRAYVNYAFVSSRLRKTVETCLKGWKVDKTNHHNSLHKTLPVFFVLTFKDDLPEQTLKLILKNWSDLISSTMIQKCDSVLIKSAPFANRNFMNSYSKGIVSNRLSSLLLSDCTTAIGCEGSPAFINNCRYSNGIVLSSVNWWRGEYTGCTFIADLKEILSELTRNRSQENKLMETMETRCLNHPVLASSELSLVQVYSGIGWGTGILLDEKSGVFITNSHVIETSDIAIVYKGRKYSANLLYKTPENEVYDLALLECESVVTDEGLRSIKISEKKCELGLTVFSAGFPFFPKELIPAPTISEGCVSKSNSFYLRTSCAVHSGDSGGAILDENGALLAVIVSNTAVDRQIFPRVNLSVPYGRIKGTIERYLTCRDLDVLKEIHVKHGAGRVAWKTFDSKL